MGVGFSVLFVLMLATAGWWLHSRWSSLRDSQAERREAELMFVFEARSRLRPDGAGSPAVPPTAPGDFAATRPGR